ncbi:hypothetical protein ABGB09_34265 [Streptomyces sp. B8F3]|uniref:hypothetical protein n=1 Tax=Streptomyces sp. B8F3 TaxID=3153573 RepID=UPI00325E4919
MPFHANTQLQRAIEKSGYTQDDLAEAINKAHEELYGTPGRCSDRQVRRLLTGEVTWPRDPTRLPLETVLGQRATELGFRPPPQSAPRGRTVRATAPTHLQDLSVQRRTFVLGLTGSMIVLPTLPDSGRLGMADIRRIYMTADRLHQLDDQYGGAQLSEAAARYIEYVEHSARRCSFGSRVETALYQALGGMATSAGWFAFDSRQQDTARRWWDAGLRYALLAGDRQLQARVWSSMSHQAYHLGHGGEAVSIARAALDETRGRRDGHLSSLLHSRVAQGHALQGERGWCGRSLLRSEQTYDQHRPSEQRWLRFYNAGEVHSSAALCYRDLGQHTNSVDSARKSLAVIESTKLWRNLLAAHTRVARALLAAGEADEAIASGDRALNLLPQVRSPRVVMRLAEFRDGLIDSGAPGATDFSDRYKAVAA